MKRFFSILFISALAMSCQKKDENNNEEILALLLLSQNQGQSTCRISLSGFNTQNPAAESIVPNTPITKVSGLNREVVVKFGPVPNTNNHRIGAVNVVAKKDTEITFVGGNFFSVVFERGAGCPIGTANRQTQGTDFEYIGGTVTNSPQTSNQDLVTQTVTIQFQKSGNFFITPYLLSAPLNQTSTEGNLKVAITKL